MGSAIPFSGSISLSFSPDDSQPQAVRSLTLTGSFDVQDDDLLSLTGAGTESLTLKAAAKVLFIKVDSSATAAAINVIANGGADTWEISPGGGILYMNPVPSAGITSLDIVYTTSNIVRVVALG